MRLVTLLLVLAGGLALAALPLSSAALVVAGAAVVIATLIQPVAGLYLLVFAVPFGSLRSVALGGMALTATELLVALLAAAWLMRGVVRRSITIPHLPLFVPFVLILMTQLLSLFDALSLSLAVKELIKWSEMLVVYVIAAAIAREGKESAPYPHSVPAILVGLMLVAALAEALLGAYQFFQRAGPEWFQIGRFMRAYGTFAQPNPYAGYLNLSLPLGYAFALAYLERRGRSLQSVLSPRGGLLVGWLAIVGGAALMSLSRGAWLGLAAGCVVITLLYSRRTAVAMTAGGVLLAAVLMLGSANLLPPAITDRFTSVAAYFRIFDVRHVTVTDANFAVVERMAHWQAAWGMIQDRPWLGFGAGNYAAAYARYALAGWQEPLGHAHNVLLNVAAETGLVGLSAYVLFLMVALWMCWWTACSWRLGPAAAQVSGLQVRRNRAPYARALALGVLGVMVAKITHEMLDNLWVHSMGVQVAMLLALVSAGAAQDNTGSKA